MNSIQELASIMDHTMLHPTAGQKQLKEECALAKKYAVAALCVKPYMVAATKELLRGSAVKTCCVIGFPSGNASIASKEFEAADAAKAGADEVDMVINIAKALEGEWAYLEEEIGRVTQACHENGAIVKVIIETDYLENDDQIIRLCEICASTGADFIKTSTGFGFKKNAEGQLFYEGATIDNLKLMKKTCGNKVKVKASGGVRDLKTFLAIKELGCERVGLSATSAILDEAEKLF